MTILHRFTGFSYCFSVNKLLLLCNPCHHFVFQLDGQPLVKPSKKEKLRQFSTIFGHPSHFPPLQCGKMKKQEYTKKEFLFCCKSPKFQARTEKSSGANFQFQNSIETAADQGGFVFVPRPQWACTCCVGRGVNLTLADHRVV